MNMYTLGLSLHASAPTTYRARRRATLDFESLGGERVNPADLAARQQIRSRRFRVVGHQEEKTMSSHAESSRVVRPPTFRHHRDESFDVTGALAVHVTTRSGDVTVLAGEAGRAEVRLGTNRAKDAVVAVDRANVEFDARRATLLVETTPRAARGLRGASFSDWFDRGGDVDVVLVLPEGSAVQVTTVSGDTVLDAQLGEVEVSSVSGDVRALHEVASLDVRTASGDVNAGAVRNRLRCRVASGDVRLAQAAPSTDVASASGDVTVTVAAPGDLSVNAASGDVTVKVVEGVAIDVTGRSVSGDVKSRIDLDGLDGSGQDAQLSTIKVTTVSGDILIDRVSA